MNPLQIVGPFPAGSFTEDDIRTLVQYELSTRVSGVFEALSAVWKPEGATEATPRCVDMRSMSSTAKLTDSLLLSR